MIRIEIPGWDTLEIRYVVLDYNGTIALDGRLIPGIGERVSYLCEHAKVYVLTADTYGSAAAQCQGLGAEIRTFPQAAAAASKAGIVRGLSGDVACIGNGFNDIEMFDLARLSIAVMDGEGVCAGLLAHAHVLARSAAEGLDMLIKPDRLRATLRR